MNLKYIVLGILGVCGGIAQAEINYSGWMSELPDTVKIRSLSLPGAHDAATSSLTGGSTGGKTQTYTIADQWEKGVRVFDLRPREDMNIYHTLNTKVTMDDVFSTLTGKLEENPDEFAVCIVRFERDEPTEAQLTEWQAKMAELMTSYDNSIVEFSPSLKVKNARGKILVLTRNEFESAKAGLLLDWAHWPTLAEQQEHFVTMQNGRSKIKAYLQDKFEYDKDDVKKIAVNGLLSYGSANTFAPFWVINHASGYIPSSLLEIGATTQFENNAKLINPYLTEKISNLGGRTGILLMDFAGDNTFGSKDLVDAVINQNFKYLTKNGAAGTPGGSVDESEIQAPEGYELVWHDEFNGVSLGEDWTYEIQESGWVNNELQNYVKDPVDGDYTAVVANGKLNINCFKGADGKVYSARVYARPNQGWTYGYFEASINLPSGKGTWPAFWMMPVEFNGWPDSGEMDIMEEVGVVPNEVSSSLHALGHYHANGTQVTAAKTLDGAEGSFHKYALEWTPEKITTYVDGEVLLTYSNDGSGDRNWPYHNPFYLILNLAWGGDWGGMQGVDESALPATMQVDYVRVFQKNEN